MMYIKEAFRMMKVGIQNIVVATGEEEEKFGGILRLNSTGAFLWENAGQGFSPESLTEALMKEYDIDEETARRGAGSFIDSLKKHGVTEENEEL